MKLHALFFSVVSALVAVAGVRNPVLNMDVPDMSVCRKGDTYYMISTTMHLVPGAPIMRSKDLVHWETVSYVYDRLESNGSRNDLVDGGTIYGHGQWASSIRYHNGKFYVWFVCNGSRGYIYTADQAEGPWTLLSRPEFMHDGSLFFDDDGRVYVFNGTGMLDELKADLSAKKPDGLHRQLFERDADEQALLEGSSVFKKDGKYYLCMISMDWSIPGRLRREVCYRADSLEGEWEKKVILETPFESYGGVGQGCVFEKEDGSWAAIIFQDRGGVGRVPCVMPCRWVDGWPMLGDSDGKIPCDYGMKFADPSGVVGSDDFAADKLKLYWQWNHNPDNRCWSLSERPGWLRLKTSRVVDNLYAAPNTLTQRMVGPTCEGKVKLDCSRMKEGDVAGFAAFQGTSAVLNIMKKDGRLMLVAREEQLKLKQERAIDQVIVKETGRTEAKGDVVYLKVTGDFRPGKDEAELYWSENGQEWHHIGGKTKLRFDISNMFMGTKFAIFYYATKEVGGAVDVDWFDFAATEHETKEAIFTDFAYEGKDPVPEFDPETEYLNPILGGMAPDPAMTRKGEDYYLAQSSFSYFPGIPVYHSKNLIDWDFAGYVGMKPSQLNLPKGVGLSAGVFAPDIKYNQYNDTFYLIVTVIGDRGNVVYKSKNPYEGWSDPIKVPVGGIDPSFFFEDDKTAWILNNDDAPDRKAEYDGHRTVRIRKYDLLTDTVVPGTEKILINKGIRPEEKPIWCEGPHLYKIGGEYYVMTAEGGTGPGHSEVIWHSDTLTGPYVPCEGQNPILTQRDLPWKRPNHVSAAGHADLFYTGDKDVSTAEGFDAEGWFAVFLAMTPHQFADGRLMTTTGRNTFLLPVKWEGEGRNRRPLILTEKTPIELVGKKSGVMFRRSPGAKPVNGNVVIKEPFTDGKLDPQWFQMRTPTEEWYKLTGKGLEMQARNVKLYDRDNPSLLARWVRNRDFTAEVTVDFAPKSEQDLAGFVLQQNDENNFVLGVTGDGKGGREIVLRKSSKGNVETVARAPIAADGKVSLKMEMVQPMISFSYQVEGTERKPLGAAQEAQIVSTEYAGGFVAAAIGLYSTVNAIR